MDLRDSIIGEISKTYVFVSKGAFQILYETNNEEFYCTTNGAFGQRDTHIERVPPSIARTLIGQSKNQLNP